MKRFIIMSFQLAFAMSVSGNSLATNGLPYLGIAFAYAEEDWKKEFDDICGQTEDGNQLNKEELRGLVVRSDALKSRFEKFEDPQRKVMLSRLKRCRDFFAYLLAFK